MSEAFPDMTPPPRNGFALIAMILGLLAILTSPIVIGGILGLIALILGIVAITRPGRKDMSITGITTGSLAILAAGIAAAILTLLPTLAAARATAKEAVARSNMKALLQGCFIHAASNADRSPEHLAVIVAAGPGPMGIDPVRVLRDPRLGLPPMAPPPPGTPWRTITGDVDAHCDFFYAPPEKLNVTPHPSEFIILYDKGVAGPTRIVAFADGHIESFPPSDAARLTAIVEACNRTRISLRLSPLALDLKSAPPPPPPPLPAKSPAP